MYSGFGQAIRFQSLTTDDGLSHNQIDAIAQDAQGFMWFGTYDGLNRYDGYRFTVYRHAPDDSTSLSNNWIETLYVDRTGTLWVGSRFGLNRYDPATDTFIRYLDDQEGVRIGVVTTICQDHTGMLWIGTFNGLLRYDPATETFTRFTHDPTDANSLSDDRVIVVYEDNRGTLWIGTGSPWRSRRDEGGLNRFDREHGTFTHYMHDPNDVHSLSNNWVHEVYEDLTGTMWVGTWEDGLHRFDRERGTFTRSSQDPRLSLRIADFLAAVGPESPKVAVPDPGFGITFVHEEQRGTGIVWIGTFNAGVVRYDRVTGKMTHYRHDPLDPNSLNANLAWTIFEDRLGTLWIGTWRGLNKLAPTVGAFKQYIHDPSDPRSLGADDVLALYEDADGVLWIGTDAGLDRMDPATGTFTHYRHAAADPASLSGNYIGAVNRDAAGVLWVGTDRGLDRMDPATGTFTHYPHAAADSTSLSDNFVDVVFEDADGVLWIGTNGGLDRMDRATSAFMHYTHDPGDPKSLSDNYVNAIIEADGVLWIGTDRGVNCMNPSTGIFTHYRYQPDDPTSLGSDMVNAIFQDPQGTIWVGTRGGGLNRFNPSTGTFSRFTIQNGFPSNWNADILSDDDGNLWVSTDKGLAKFNPRTEQARTYDLIDGLPTNVFNNGTFFKSSDGTLYFGSNKGFIAFNPRDVEEDTRPPNVVITRFARGNQPLNTDQPIWQTPTVTLDHNDLLFSVEFATLDFAMPAKNRYAYQLVGLSDEWVDLGNQHSYTFTGLPPGRYRFTVRGSNSRGVWNEEGATLAIRITPPWWATWWFRLLGLAGLVALVAGAIRLRFRSIEARNQHLQQENAARQALIDALEAKNAELERFTYTVSHDLKSPLVTIKGFIGLLKRDSARADARRVEQDIEQINNAADTMFSLLNELLELSRIGHLMNPPESVPLTPLVHEAVDLLAGHLDYYGVSVEIASAMPPVFGDRTRLLEVFQNLIENAAKFMDGQATPLVQVGARRDGEMVLCHVRDNGQGIDPAYHEKVFGLFERLDAAQEGTGVGLTLVRRIVEVHGGRIWVESAGAGQGSTFYFTLPAQKHVA